mmetsp:Transcript_7527/g.12515  ORF Transcript_7527/g.12515 Transcript_7527/m.12515 type:complete len:148 (-) Transcript_7527:187-630(-)
MFKLTVLLIVLLAASALAFNARVAPKPARMSMLFNFGGKKDAPKKSAPAASKTGGSYKPGAGTANKGTYVPEGLSKAQYEAFLKSEAEAKAKKAKKFVIGKEVETLTEWMEAEAKKGNTGVQLNTKGHRMVKAKDPAWYTDENPVNQ